MTSGTEAPVRGLSVTGHDLCTAAGLDEQPPAEAAVVTCALLGRLAATGDDPTGVIRALGGRRMARTA